MPTTSPETVRLDLEGTFAKMAEEDAQAATKLATALDLMGRSASRVQAPKLGATGESIKGLERQVAELQIAPQLERKRLLLQKQLDKMRADIKASIEPPKADGKWASAMGGAGGEDDQVGQKFAGMGGMAGGALGVAAVGLAVITGLAYKAASAVYDLGKSFTELGVEQTSKAEVQRQIFKKLGGDYDVDIRLAAKYGLDADAAARDIKRLLKAKFSQEQIEVDLKIIAGLGAVEGEEKAKAYVEKLAQAANKGKKANEEIVKGFAEAGIDTERIYQELAKKMGISVDKAKAKVKAGAVDMKDALDAVRKAAEADFGDIGGKLGNSVPALVARVKLALLQLFSDFDLTPLKDALKNATELLEGAEGKQLKQAFSEAGSEIIKTLFGPFQGPEGKQRLIAVMAELVSIMHEVRDAAKAAAPAVRILLDLLGAAPAEKGEGLADITKKQKKAADLGSGPLRGEGGWGKYLHPLGPLMSPDATSDALGLPPLADGMKDKAAPIGDAINQGLAEAMQNNPAAVTSAIALGDEILAQLRARLGVASPSKEAAKIGAFFNQGFGVGAEGDNSAARAGRAIAAQASEGAAGAVAGGAGGRAGGGGGDTYQFYFQASGNGTNAEQGAEMGDAAYRRFQEHRRREAREARA